MADTAYLEAVKKKIRSLQEQADDAESNMLRLQEELASERAARQSVSLPAISFKRISRPNVGRFRITSRQRAWKLRLNNVVSVSRR